jgi:type I restriction enzyme M protein
LKQELHRDMNQLNDTDFGQKIRDLIDGLKGICASYGLGNDGNEFKIITQVFLYKLMNDKFAFEVKQAVPEVLEGGQSWESALRGMSEEDYEFMLLQLPSNTANLKPDHFIATLYEKQNDKNFAKLFDDTLIDIAFQNNEIFSVKTEGDTKIPLFDRVSEFITDTSKRDNFCRAVINQLIKFSAEHIFTQKYDFFATLFEYLIKDYNKDSGGKYAEYYTPHAVARIMAAILVSQPVQDVTVYDPSAGSGTLLMSLAHAIGEERCTIYSQDISQKSSSLLRLNLILNNLVHSIPNIIQGNTLEHPYHKDGAQLAKFDYIVSNPPFKMDFSDYVGKLGKGSRFFAGIPNVPNKAKDKMAIYTLFLQHIIYSLKPKGKAAVVVPTGFITAQSGIDRAIREKLVNERMLAGVVSMPSNIFATTGTNVSILFMDRGNQGDVVLIDASGLGETVKDGKNQKTVLTEVEEAQIISTFNEKKAVDDFSVVVSYEEIAAKNYSLSAGQYFDVKIEYVDISQDEFEEKLRSFSSNLDRFFAESGDLEVEIKKQLAGLKYE